MAKSKKPREFRSKSDRIARERLINRLVTYTTIGIVALSVVIVSWGVILENIIQPGQPVATVNGEKITTQDFQARVRYERRQLVAQYLQESISLQFFQGNDAAQAQILSNLRQIELQLEPQIAGSNTLNTMIDDLLILQEAKNMGITVTEEEIDQFIETLFGYYPTGRPTSTTTPTLIPTSTLSPTQLAMVTLVPTQENTATPTNTPEPEVEPQTQEDAQGQPTPTIEPSPSPTSTPYTFDAFQEDYQAVIATQEAEISFTGEEFRHILEIALYRQKISEALSAEVEPVQEQVWAQHILVEDEETALEVLQKLEAGEDWSELAAEYSTDTSNKDNGGDLGWFSSAAMVAEFSTTAFSTPIGQITGPVETTFGYHIIRVLGHEVRPVEQYLIQRFYQEIFDNWLNPLRENAQIEVFDQWTERVPDEPDIPLGYRLPQQQP